MQLLIALVLMPIILMFTALLGYFVGIILEVTPLIGDLLENDVVDTPTLMAWLGIGMMWFAMLVPKGGGNNAK